MHSFFTLPNLLYVYVQRIHDIRVTNAGGGNFLNLSQDAFYAICN